MSDTLLSLEPCPFCEEAEFIRAAQDSIGAMAVICSRCGAEGPPCAEAFGVAPGGAANEAIRLWNTRATLQGREDKR